MSIDYRRKYLSYGGSEALHPSLDRDAKHLYLKYATIPERNRSLEDIFFFKKYILYKNKYLKLKNLIGGNPSGELSFGSFSDDEEEAPLTCKNVPYLGDSLVPIVIPDNIVGIIKKEGSNPRHIINYENNLSDHPLIHSIDGELLFLSLNVESASAILKNINYNINNLVPPINDANKCGLEKNRISQFTLSEDVFIKLIIFRYHGIFIKLMMFAQTLQAEARLLENAQITTMMEPFRG
jgi:hypothetical protein